MTFPNHFTLVTGLLPHNHGIINNVFFDPALNHTFTLSSSLTETFSVEPIWITLQKQRPCCRDVPTALLNIKKTLRVDEIKGVSGGTGSVNDYRWMGGSSSNGIGGQNSTSSLISLDSNLTVFDQKSFNITKANNSTLKINKESSDVEPMPVDSNDPHSSFYSLHSDDLLNTDIDLILETTAFHPEDPAIGGGTTILYWPLSEATFSETVGGTKVSNRADISYVYDFKSLKSNQDRMLQVLHWLDLPIQSRPQLIMSYFNLVDAVGHFSGTKGPKIQRAVKEVDDAIGILLDGIQERNINPNVVILSDHGMQDVREAIALANEGISVL